MELPEIIIRLKEDPHPSELSHIKTYLSADYASRSMQLEEVLSKRDDEWFKLRDAEGCTSDKQADRAWEKTIDGKKERRLRLEMKAIEKMISAVSTRINVANHEMRGDY
jgi:hypothetical protein